jgi:desulfoferrodoxin (superoxide reductase-like protein)
MGRENMKEFFKSRRQFLGMMGTTIVLPIVVGCQQEPEGENDSSSQSLDINKVPSYRPEGWNPIQYNLERGLKGAIPESYHESITGVDGDLLHIGKHIPYLAPIDPTVVPEGYIALMMGDARRGYAQHPNTESHWYDWVKISVEGASTVYKNEFNAWPTSNNIISLNGDTSANGGKETVYLVKLPPGASAGDTIRVIAHCSSHGEYVDFITL